MIAGKKELAQMLDVCALHPTHRARDVERVAAEALRHGAAVIFVKPCYIPDAVAAVAGSGVKVCTGIAFQLGGSTTASKVFQARDAVAKGASELELLVDSSRILMGADDYVVREIAAVLEAAGPQVLVKVVFELGDLTDPQKVRACVLAKEAGARFVGVTTGLSASPYRDGDVKLARAALGADIGIKVAGGMMSYEQAVSAVEAGATRLGVGFEQVSHPVSFLMAAWDAAHER